MEKTKKILSILTIVFTAIVSLLLILALFKINFLGDVSLQIYVTLGSLAIGGFFAISSLMMVPKNKIIGWLSLGLISGSVFLIILSVWLDLGNSTLLNITISLGLLSVLFNIIVSIGLDLGKLYLIIQIVVYMLVGIVDILSTLAIFGVIDLGSIVAIFLTLIILSLVGIITLKVLAKRKVSNNTIEEKNIIKISKEEYALLIEKAKKYDEYISNQNNQQK